SGLRPRDADRQRVPLRAVRRLAVLRSRRARDGELSAPGGVELADPARDEGGCLLVAVGAEIRPAVPGGDGLAARTSRGRARKRISGPSRGIGHPFFTRPSFGGRVHPGRDYAYLVSQSMLRGDT